MSPPRLDEPASRCYSSTVPSRSETLRQQRDMTKHLLFCSLHVGLSTAADQNTRTFWHPFHGLTVGLSGPLRSLKHLPNTHLYFSLQLYLLCTSDTREMMMRVEQAYNERSSMIRRYHEASRTARFWHDILSLCTYLARIPETMLHSLTMGNLSTS